MSVLAPTARTRVRIAVPTAAALALVLSSPLLASSAWAGDDDKKAAKGSQSGQSGQSGDRGSKGGDPAGNNGTVKIDGVPLDSGRGNEPHVECAFALDFYGFDDDQTADITFTGKPPTGPDRVLLAQKGVAISDDAAGGGQDRDAEILYTAAQLGLTGEAPHRNGWHVKVAVDVLEAPGGAKQKVFWLDCDQQDKGTAPTGTTPTGTTPTGTAPTGTTPTGTTPTGTAPTGTTPTGTAPTGTAPTGTTPTGTAPTGTTTTTTTGTTTGTTVADTDSDVAGVFGEAPVSANGGGSTEVSGSTGALAATGGEIATLIALALASLGVGTAGVLAGRRSREVTA